MSNHDNLQAVAVFVIIGLTCFFGFLATPWFPSPLNWNLAVGSTVVVLIIGIIYFAWRRFSKKSITHGISVITKDETGSRVRSYKPIESEASALKEMLKPMQAFEQGLLRGLHSSRQAPRTRHGLRNYILSHLRSLMSEWNSYERVSPPERWVSLSHDSMQKHASEIADEILRLTSKHPDLWDAAIIGELNVIAGELRQFAAKTHPETTEEAKVMDQHGKNAYSLARALLSRISPK